MRCALSVANHKSYMGTLTNAGTAIPEHPPFDPVNNAGMPALQQFYAATDAATIAAGPNGCGPSKIISPQSTFDSWGRRLDRLPRSGD